MNPERDRAQYDPGEDDPVHWKSPESRSAADFTWIRISARPHPGEDMKSTAAALVVITLLPATLFAQRPVVTMDMPMSPPTWALLQRQLLEANAQACREYFDK